MIQLKLHFLVYTNNFIYINHCNKLFYVNVLILLLDHNTSCRKHVMENHVNFCPTRLVRSKLVPGRTNYLLTDKNILQVCMIIFIIKVREKGEKKRKERQFPFIVPLECS